MLLVSMDAKQEMKPTLKGEIVQDLEDIRQIEKLHSRTEAIGFVVKFYKLSKVHEQGIRREEVK